MDPLQEIPRDQWPTLRDLYLSNWPDELEGYCFLDTQISCPGLAEEFKIKIYSPEGNIQNGCIAIEDQDKISQIAIYPVNGDTKTIEQALLNTKIINWKREIMIPSVKPDILDAVRRIAEELSLTIRTEDGVYKHLLSKHSTPYENITCPPGTYLGPVRPEHIKIVDETWTFHNENSYEYFKKLVNYSHVIYSNDHKPMAWIHVDETGSFSHLYCLEDYRKNGYAEIITKVAVNDLLKQERHALAYTLEDNIKPQKLFTKLGFETFGQVSWVFLKQK